MDDVLLLQFLSLPKGKRLLCRAFGALDPAGRLCLAAAGMRLLPQFVASTQRDQVSALDRMRSATRPRQRC